MPERTDPQVTVAAKSPRLRVGLMKGCVQPVLNPGIDAAAIRLLQRLGVAVVQPDAPACCGALPHHMGQTERAEADVQSIDKAREEGRTLKKRAQALIDEAYARLGL